MKKILRIIQPYLLAIAPLVVLFRNNPGEIFLFDFLFVTASLVIFICILWYSVFKWTKDPEKTSIFISVLCLPLILSIELPSISKPLIWSFCALNALLCLKLSISPKWKSILAYGFSIPLLGIIAYNSFEIGREKAAIRMEIAQHKLTPLPQKIGATTCSRDIYVIILDEFISENAFNNYYHVNNQYFFDNLRKKGFHLVSSSTSNYPWTITSIASMLNFDYHDTNLSKNVFTGVAQFLIEQNRLFRILKEEGYSICHIPSIYWMGNPPQNPASDFLFRTRSYGLIQTVSQITPLKNTYRTYQRNSHRDHVLYQLDQLKLISQNPEKKLVFAHIMCPHRPIAFAEDGSMLSDPEIIEAEKDSEHRFYLGQAKFISKEVIKTVDHILEHSSAKPLILILSDHGKFPIGCNPKGKATLSLDEIAWRFSNLQALYFPDFDDSLPDETTPVNTIRIMLNHYFGYDLPLIENACCPHFYDLSQRVPSQLVLDHLSVDNHGTLAAQ